MSEYGLGESYKAIGDVKGEKLPPWFGALSISGQGLHELGTDIMKDFLMRQGYKVGKLPWICCDIIADKDNERFLVEVKSVSTTNVLGQVYHGVGQLLYYAFIAPKNMDLDLGLALAFDEKEWKNYVENYGGEDLVDKLKSNGILVFLCHYGIRLFLINVRRALVDEHPKRGTF